MDKGIMKIMKQAGFDKELSEIDKGICPSCHKKVKAKDFKNDLEVKEFNVLGLCQGCQSRKS